MTGACLIAVTTILLEIIPVMSHRLITNPYPDTEWDSIIVSSDPITVKEKKDNKVADSKSHPPSVPRKRSFESCPENDFGCLYGNSEDNSNDQIVNRFIEQYSGIANVNVAQDDRNGTEKTENDNSGKSYWSAVDTQNHRHPYNDKNGWVSLDPVPWSASKISKWQPNGAGVHQGNRPWDYGPTTRRPVQHFWVGTSTLDAQRPTTQWGLATNDIITDNKPSHFPTANHNTYDHSPHGYIRPDNDYYGYSNTHKDFHQNPGNHPPKYSQNAHPSSYPNNGNGEWVLLSTTKGYSIPQRHRWSGNLDASKTDGRMFGSRKIKPDISRYHEEELTGRQGNEGASSNRNRKSDESSTKDTAQNQTTAEKNPVEVLYAGSTKGDEPVKTFRRKVRLQVLPSLKNTSISHGGLLEVDANHQTVDEAQQEDEKLKNLKAIANIRKNKIRGYKLVPVNRIAGKGTTSKNAMAVAAVGAGMIPATMALLVPMALGRKRRSLIQGQGNIVPLAQIT